MVGLVLRDIEKMTGANRNTLKKHLADLVASGTLLRLGKGKATWYTLPSLNGYKTGINRMFQKKQLQVSFLIAVICMMPFSVKAEQPLLTLFPLDRYTQKVDAWIKPSDPNYETPLLSSEIQKKKAEQFYEHFAGSLSPWHQAYVNPHIIHAEATQKAAIEKFGNQNKSKNQLGYGVNFRPYPIAWIQKIENNMRLSQFSQGTYQDKLRGIAINNLHARLLPTEDVHYYSHTLAGEGYPFDNLQMSSIWVGTPVYILGESQDHHWLLVLTPDFVAWVKANGIARVSDIFVKQWQAQAKQNLAAITRTETPLKNESGRYLYLAYVGSVFPAEVIHSSLKIMVPVADAQGNARIQYAKVSSENATIIPLKATPKHFAKIIRTLVGRPYGWGNLYFYNDCSAELKNLFTPFGIWLPRQSYDQPQAGKIVDLSSSSKEQRLAYLLEKGRPFMTIVYIGGHVILYTGKHPTLDVPMTYQNLWGLSPNPPLKRVVIGKAVFLPMLLQYPEDTNLISQSDKGTFQMIYLDEAL